MSTVRDSSMDAQVSEADVIINRMNVALARSQRLINSWLPPKSEHEEEAAPADDIDEEFRSMTDEAGLGSKAAYGDDEESSAALLKRKRLASGDKLLEQLLGKKAAQAHKKAQSQVVGKSMAASKHAAPKSLTSRLKPMREAESESEDEGGRSSAFKSRKADQTQRGRVVEPSTPLADAREVDGTNNVDMAEADQADDGDEPTPAVRTAVLRTNAAKNKRSTSYLDELLSHKAQKRSKKKKAKH